MGILADLQRDAERQRRAQEREARQLQREYERAQREEPLELLDGSNLLYLLREEAGVEARIDPPEDWVDPEGAEVREEMTPS